MLINYLIGCMRACSLVLWLKLKLWKNLRWYLQVMIRWYLQVMSWHVHSVAFKKIQNSIMEEEAV
jgi:hypothetical protein